MIAGQLSLEKLVTNRLRRWGLKPLRRDGKLFIINPRRLHLSLGSFFTVLEYDEEIKMADPNEPIMDILHNRVKNWEDPLDPFKKYADDARKDHEYKKAEAEGAFNEMIKDVSKLQVQVK